MRIALSASVCPIALGLALLASPAVYANTTGEQRLHFVKAMINDQYDVEEVRFCKISHPRITPEEVGPRFPEIMSRTITNCYMGAAAPSSNLFYYVLDIDYRKEHLITNRFQLKTPLFAGHYLTNYWQISGTHLLLQENLAPDEQYGYEGTIFELLNMGLKKRRGAASWDGNTFSVEGSLSCGEGCKTTIAGTIALDTDGNVQLHARYDQGVRQFDEVCTIFFDEEGLPTRVEKRSIRNGISKLTQTFTLRQLKVRKEALDHKYFDPKQFIHPSVFSERLVRDGKWLQSGTDGNWIEQPPSAVVKRKMNPLILSLIMVVAFVPVVFWIIVKLKHQRKG